jgi:hypothetical protein
LVAANAKEWKWLWINEIMKKLIPFKDG